MKIDNLNVTITEYFETLRLPKVQIRKRIEIAKQLKNLFEVYIDLIVDELEIEDLYLLLRYDMAEIIGSQMPLTDANFNRLDLVSKEFIDTTYNRGVLEEEPYFTSEDRAELVAVNEAQAHGNIDQYNEAKERGMKYKQWFTTLDERARETHLLADLQKVPIDEPFKVGDSLMMFPMDLSLGASPEETINCRCTMQYTRY